MKLYDSTSMRIDYGHKEFAHGLPCIGEIINGIPFGTNISINGKPYVFHIMNHEEQKAIVSEISFCDEEDESDNLESDLTCPYCGYVDRDSFELSDDDDHHECGECGSVFSFNRVVTVEYEARPVSRASVTPVSLIEAQQGREG